MKQKFTVTGMTCSACSAHVEKAVCKLEGVASSPPLSPRATAPSSLGRRQEREGGRRPPPEYRTWRRS